jgi:hypothetical protein
VPTGNGKSNPELGRRWPGLDIRADGGYALFTGKTDKGEYTWLREPGPEDLSILPADLLEFLGLLNPPGTAAKTKHLLANGYYDSSRVDPERLIRRALGICQNWVTFLESKDEEWKSRRLVRSISVIKGSQRWFAGQPTSF